MNNKLYTLDEFNALETRRKRGELREDGYIFSKYMKKAKVDGQVSVREVWRSPESMERENDRARERANAWYSQPENKDRHRDYQREWRGNNRERHRERRLQQYYKNKPAARARERRAYRNNPEKHLRITRERTALTISFAAQLPESVRKTIGTFYDCAKRVSACTGIKHHVDHIVPIRGDGWHVPNNLQVIPERVNIKKGQNVMIFALDNEVDYKQTACA